MKSKNLGAGVGGSCMVGMDLGDFLFCDVVVSLVFLSCTVLSVSETIVM